MAGKLLVPWENSGLTEGDSYALALKGNVIVRFVNYCALQHYNF